MQNCASLKRKSGGYEMAGRTAYVYGNAARKLSAEPARRIWEEPEREVRPGRQPQKRPQPVRKRRVDKVSVVLIAITFAIAFSICYYYLQLQFQSTYLGKSVVGLENEVLEMEKENSNDLQELEESVDLGAIYKKATKELGMKSAVGGQIFTYESKKSTQVRLHHK